MLTVTKKGDANGLVTSNPTGIDCGSDCEEAYIQGTKIALSALPDTEKIILTGWSGGGCSGTGACTVTLTSDTTVSAEFNYLPTADFEASPTTVGIIPYVPVSFTDRSLHTTSWLWDFGDGTTSTEQNPTHIYTGVGIYTVSLTAINPYGSEVKTISNLITVEHCPNMPVRLVRSSGASPQYYDTIQAAYDDALDSDTIQSLAVTLKGDVVANRDISIAIAGGYACDYSGAFGRTVLQGSMATNAGVVKIGNLELISSMTGDVFSVSAAADVGGSISPYGTFTKNRGTSETFTITPDSGYSIVNVLVDGVPVGPVETYELANINNNHRIEAIFTNTLTVTKTGTATGRVTSSPAGIDCGADCAEKYAAGTVVTLTGTPDDGAILAGWSGGGCTGQGACTVTMNDTTSVTAIFDIAPPVADFNATPETVGLLPPSPITFTDLSLRAQSWSWDFGDGGTSTERNPEHTYSTVGVYAVTLTVTNTTGTNTITKYVTVQSCAELPVKVVPANAGSLPSYYRTIQAAYTASKTGDVLRTLAANFVENVTANQDKAVSIDGGYGCGFTDKIGITTLQGQLTTSAGSVTIGDFELVTSTTGDVRTIVSTASPGGVISPAGTVTAASGANMTFTLTPDPNYFIHDVFVNGASIGPVSTYTFNNITANHTIEAVFATNYTITATAGPNGSISPSGPVTVVSHFSQEFAITPVMGYHVADVLVDGGSVGAVSSYTFNDVMADHTISASFAINNYTITASAGLGGSISPSGAVSAADGSSQTFTMTPDTGYGILDVLVDDVSVGPVSTYTFGNVTTPHTIRAIFAIRLTVTKSGTGTGTITSVPAGINCGGSCTAEYVLGSTITLTAVPAPGMIFDGWTGGGCSGTSTTCTVALNTSTTVNASFTISSAAIAGSPIMYYRTIQDAYTAAADGAAIMVRDTVPAQSLSANLPKNVSIAGGYNVDYTSGAGVTALKGSIVTTMGRVTIKNFILQK